MQVANEKRVIAKAGQAFVLAGFTVTPQADVPLVFTAHNGEVPWLNWDREGRAAKLTTRKLSLKP